MATVTVVRYKRRKRIGDEKSPMVYALKLKSGEAKIYSIETLAREIESIGSLSVEDVSHVMKSFVRAMKKVLVAGDKVKVDGLGVFTPSLGLREGFERESAEQGGQKRNVRSICVDNINFHADKDFIYETGRNCILNRSKWKFRHSSSRYTAEQRLKLAQDY